MQGTYCPEKLERDEFPFMVKAARMIEWRGAGNGLLLVKHETEFWGAQEWEWTDLNSPSYFL